MGAVGFAAKRNPCCRPSRSPSRKQGSKQGKVSENLATELRAEDNRHAKIVDTVTSKSRFPILCVPYWMPW